MWLLLAVRRGLNDRLAADSPLLLLDMDVVHGIASELLLGSPSSHVVDLLIPEIIWPEQWMHSLEHMHQEGTCTMLDDDLNTPVYDGLNLGLNSPNSGLGLLDDDDCGLDFSL